MTELGRYSRSIKSQMTATLPDLVDPLLPSEKISQEDPTEPLRFPAQRNCEIINY